MTELVQFSPKFRCNPQGWESSWVSGESEVNGRCLRVPLATGKKDSKRLQGALQWNGNKINGTHLQSEGSAVCRSEGPSPSHKLL